MCRQLVFLESRCRQNKVLSECSKASLILCSKPSRGRREGRGARTNEAAQSCRSHARISEALMVMHSFRFSVQKRSRVVVITTNAPIRASTSSSLVS